MKETAGVKAKKRSPSSSFAMFDFNSQSSMPSYMPSQNEEGNVKNGRIQMIRNRTRTRDDNATGTSDVDANIALVLPSITGTQRNPVAKETDNRKVLNIKEKGQIEQDTS